MKVIAIIGLIGVSAAVAGAGGPGALWRQYRELYPSDPGRREALDECFSQDPNLDRLEPAARAACYRHGLPALANAGIASMPHPAANFIDLWRAAGEGNMPENDVRAEEQNARFIHPASVR